MQLTPGPRGDLFVQIDGRTVAEKPLFGSPGEADVVRAVKAALGR